MSSPRSLLMIAAWLALVGAAHAGPAGELLPVARMLSTEAGAAPVANIAFVPGADARPGAEFAGTLEIGAAGMQTSPALDSPVIRGRDARLFPGISLRLYTAGDQLVPVERGSMVRETHGGPRASYWRVIPEAGRVWREPADGDWSRAAFPLMLVNDTENHAHQGLATFLYRDGAVSAVHVQFVQQTAPYLVKPHFVGWGVVTAELRPVAAAVVASDRTAFARERAARLPTAPWSELEAQAPRGALDGFGGPLKAEWTVATALLRHGTLYVRDSQTRYGPYPYTTEMRFGVRSVMKSVAAPLAALRLAELYGPFVLDLKVGDYVPGLDPKYRRVRIVDALSMASGFGGSGTRRTHPNDLFDGYLDAHYDDWYLAPSHAEKLHAIAEYLSPYPWEPGTVVRYRDQDLYLAGAALQGVLRSLRGPTADLWDFVRTEVLEPIGVAHAPAVRTQEPGDQEGLVWCNAGYYPSLDDLAKIAQLYQRHGAQDGTQILHRGLTDVLLSARAALPKTGDGSLAGIALDEAARAGGLYWLGFHYTPYTTQQGHRTLYLPTMSGSGENEVVLYPNGLVSIRTAKAAGLPDGTAVMGDDRDATLRAVERLAPF